MSRRLQVSSLIMSLMLSMALAVSALPASSARAQTPPCDLSGGRNGTATPNVVGPGNIIVFEATGFQANEDVSFWFTLPNGQVFGTAQPIPGGVNEDGTVGPLPIRIPQAFAQFPGRWAMTFQGSASNNTAIIPFCVTGQAQPTPTPNPACDVSANRNAVAYPNQVRPGDLLIVDARGFQPGEAVSFWFTLPTGQVFGTPRPLEGGVGSDGTVYDAFRIPQEFGQVQGRWAITFQGASSNNTAIAYFCVSTQVAQPTPTTPPATPTTPPATPTAAASPTAAVETPTAVPPVVETPTVVPPAVQTPTAVPPAVETPTAAPPVVVETPTPGVIGMPRTGEGDPVWLLVLLAVLGVCMLSAGMAARLTTRRRM